MKTTQDRHTFYVGGQLLEMWENPEAAFRCSPAELERYAVGGDWVSLFNALVLIGERDPVAAGC